jgi:predicted MPP superfamily phosphohydrolase
MITRWRAFVPTFVAVLLASLGVSSTASAMETAYVLVGPGGGQIARAITEAATCPKLQVDGKALAMQVRSAPQTFPQRPTASSAELSKPSDFPKLVCEANLPPGARIALLGGHALPLAPPTIRRIVLIGDTGCRLKQADKAYQACNDPSKYPFAQVAAAAAKLHPDLVVHVGDYLYRENPCPADQTGCAGSPWGYGQDAWDADFFTPAAPLLAAAPWVVVRGNHETCVRAGQGWLRLLDPSPLAPHRDCNDPADDDVGNYSGAYAVPLDADTQIAVWDSANAPPPGKPLAPDDARAIHYAQTQSEIEAIAKLKPHTFLANHHPLLAFAATKDKTTGEDVLHPGNLGLQSVFLRHDPKLFPKGVDLLLNGHIHVLEQLSFGGDYPSELVTGFSGTQEDIVPLPAHLPPTETLAPGAVVQNFSSWVDGFGFAELERVGPGAWRIRIFDVEGKQVNVCSLVGRVSKCEVDQVRR